jgi:hypothetical protein
LLLYALSLSFFFRMTHGKSQAAATVSMSLLSDSDESSEEED